MEQELLVMKNINKSFPGVHALRDVSLSLRRGEVHALIGENGAGKSTLMKVLSGVHQADSGEILWEGKPVQIHSTTEATAMGISIIYQELNLMPNMSIRENIFLGRENRKARFFVDFQKTSELAKTYTDMVGLTADVNTLVKDLSIAQRQMVEVAKALSTNAKLIVMDEPTSSLTDRETEILMNVIRNLRDQGVTVVFISHRLSELFEISDRITVLRDGECVGTIDTKDCTEPQLVNMMVGRTLDDIYPKGNAQIGEAVLEAKHLNAGKMVQDVSFTLHRGEILGFAGLIGAGRSEVMRAIFGVDPLDSGEIIIDGLDADTYYLRETAGLPGYNKLADDQEITITATPGEDEDTMTFSRPTAYINNQSGTELPSTGGMGTTMFYILGSVLVLGAAVVLITRKRMSKHN